jgi:hypothetical protein
LLRCKVVQEAICLRKESDTARPKLLQKLISIGGLPTTGGPEESKNRIERKPICRDINGELSFSTKYSRDMEVSILLEIRIALQEISRMAMRA